VNPLRSREFRIPFDKIGAEHVEPAVREALEEAERALGALVAPGEPRTYRNTIEALDELTERLSRVVTVAQHLTSVVTTPELRAAYNAVLPEFSSFFAKLPLNEPLWQAVKAFSESDEAKALGGVKKRHLEKTVRDFVRAGADLPEDKKRRLEEIGVELSRLHTKFAENALDSTNAFELILEDPKDLAGLPGSAIGQAKASAEAKGKRGWRFTLQAPSYVPFMQYAGNRDLRQRMYTAFVNRACEGDYDNRPLILQILALRKEKAGLLGYRDFADYRLEITMVKSGQEAYSFVRDLTEKTEPHWQEEVEELLEHARTLGINDLEPWDVAYVSERLRRACYDFDEEALRPYFPLESVMSGMFEICRRLFGVVVTERQIAEAWHPEVTFYDIASEEGLHLGSFYADWFPREEKRAGAWMNTLITGGPREEGFAPHLGLMVGNFTPPAGDKPALLSHREVETTFHEFGHLLHHCLSQVEVPALAGTKVAWDWVELPSQIMENWCWERQALDLFARHHESGAPLPESLFQKMFAAKTFMAANAQMRQLSFGAVDLELHRHYDPARDGDVIAYAQRIMRDFAIKPEFADNHFLTSFSHVFTGGYAAGYYSYKWSEVLDADAFTRFKSEGIFNRDTGRDYLSSILSRGDSAEPDELFREFMGRDPDVSALLERSLKPADRAAGLA
jgi:oligopeptidase A